MPRKRGANEKSTPSLRRRPQPGQPQQSAGDEASSTIPGWLPFLILFVVCLGKVGDVFGLGLFQTRPLLLLLINANDLHCGLTSADVPFAPWFAVAFVRRVIEDPLFFYLGYTLRTHALEWMARWGWEVEGLMERAVHGVSYIAVAVDPGQVICTVAGIARMEPRVFAALNVAGTVVRLLLLRGIAVLFPKHLQTIAAMIHEHRILFMNAVAIGMVAAFLWKRKIKRQRRAAAPVVAAAAGVGEMVGTKARR